MLGLAFILTLFSGGIALSVPALVSHFRGQGLWPLWLGMPFLSIPLAVLGYGSGFLDCVFASAMGGEVGYIRWPGRNVAVALKSGARWLICFLAGPALPAGMSLLYWIRGGNLGLLDWMIVGELGILAISAWFLLLLAVSEHGRWRDLNPVRIVKLVHRLGHRLVALAIFAAVVALAHGWLACVGLEKVHHDIALGWLWLFLSWTSGIFFATFLFRWVGVWFYWDSVRRKQNQE